MIISCCCIVVGQFSSEQTQVPLNTKSSHIKLGMVVILINLSSFSEVGLLTLSTEVKKDVFQSTGHGH